MPIYFKRYELTFRNKLITYKQQLQRASRGIFLLDSQKTQPVGWFTLLNTLSAL
jgi:hypothetical protein